MLEQRPSLCTRDGLCILRTSRQPPVPCPKRNQQAVYRSSPTSPTSGRQRRAILRLWVFITPVNSLAKVPTRCTIDSAKSPKHGKTPALRMSLLRWFVSWKAHHRVRGGITQRNASSGLRRIAHQGSRNSYCLSASRNKRYAKSMVPR